MMDLQHRIFCECDILNDQKELNKRDLARHFRMDFEGVELVNC
jgi:hypothetical protein